MAAAAAEAATEDPLVGLIPLGAIYKVSAWANGSGPNPTLAPSQAPASATLIAPPSTQLPATLQVQDGESNRINVCVHHKP